MDRHNGDNLGSFHTLWIARIKDIASEVFSNSFEQIYFTPDTGKCSRALQASKAGSSYAWNLVFHLPKYRQDVEIWLKNYLSTPCIAYIQLHNGEKIQIGSKKSPLFLATTLQLGESPTENNFYQLVGKATQLLVRNFGVSLAKPKPKTSYALLFNGINNFILPTTNSPFNINTGAISVRVKTDDNSNEYRAIAVKQFAYGLFKFGNELVVYDWGRSAMRQTGFFFSNQYHHIVINFTDIQYGNPNNTKIYVDGQLVCSTTILLLSHSQAFVIGAGTADFSYPQIWKGAMRQLNVYDRNLTTTEISSLYANNSINSNLILRYLLNEGNGNVAKDTSTYGNNGDLRNFLYTDFANTNQWIDENGNAIF
jgi:hypothetical protein